MVLAFGAQRLHICASMVAVKAGRPVGKTRVEGLIASYGFERTRVYVRSGQPDGPACRYPGKAALVNWKDYEIFITRVPHP
jgi:hypothetical protein